LYEEILKQTQRLISEELNDVNKRLRMRSRPKVILVHSYDEAEEILKNYKDYLITVISDVKYMMKGEIDSQAGLKLLKKIKTENYEIPVLLQSSEMENKQRADELNTKFLHKNSETLLQDLRKFILNNLGFGDLIIRNDKGKEISRAGTLLEFEKLLPSIPVESVLYHSKHNHFSAWLIAHGEIRFAKKIKPVTINTFQNPDKLREYLIGVFKEVRVHKNKGKLIRFSELNPDETDRIVRLSEGSLGGKGRGLAFLTALFVAMEPGKNFPNEHLHLPRTAIIGTHEFDRFVEKNNITTDLFKETDEKICEVFVAGELSSELKTKLRKYMKNNKEPLAVRSSSLLEDSQSQPFAGVYDTFFVPNNQFDDKVRFEEVYIAVKKVYASVFYQRARNYIKNTHFQPEEEKMAVILQEVVGQRYDNILYPHISGVAQSYNYYPTANLENSDGIASIAFGLGESVVGGEKSFLFCPKYPQIEIISEDEVIRNTQKKFYALNMDSGNSVNYSEPVVKKRIKEVKQHNCFNLVSSVWDIENNRLTNDTSRRGPVITDFKNIIRNNAFPLAEIISYILDVGVIAFGVPVEIEFAVNLDKRNESGKPSFALLQVRPLTVNPEIVSVDLENLNPDELLLYTEKGMGNGIKKDIYDVVFFDEDAFDNTKTEEMAIELENINAQMVKEDRKYILIAPGRFGSRDRFLGIPVRWDQISNAEVIVEYGLHNFNVDSSQGTHFFHNLMAMDVGYFSIPYGTGSDFLKLDWLESRKPFNHKYFKHIKSINPFIVKMVGSKGISLIYKPLKK
jgi:hypothetical protein